MIFFKSIIIILIHYFFVHFLLYEKNLKNDFNQKIFINSITSIFIIVTFTYILNSLNFFILRFVFWNYFLFIEK